MAAHAGVPAVAVSYGAHVKADLDALSPLACLDSVDELTQWLKRNA
jgi:phosphoglycolate phosphatase